MWRSSFLVGTPSHWPKVAEIADELEEINASVEGRTTVRLYVVGRKHLLHVGDQPREQNETDADPVGSVVLPGVVNGEVQLFDAEALARNLIGQARRSRC